MSSFYVLLDKLLSGWDYWDLYEDYYLYELIPQFKRNDFSQATEKETELLKEIKSLATADQWNNLETIARQIRSNKSKRRMVREKINAALGNLDFDSAEELFRAYPGAISESEYNQLKNQYRKEYAAKKWLEIEQKLHEYDFDCADRLFESVRDVYFAEEYNHLKKWYQKEYTAKKQIEIERKLREYDFNNADRLFKSIGDIYSVEEYNHLKEQYKKKHATKTLALLLNSNRFVDADQFFWTDRFLSKDEYEAIKSNHIKRCLETNGIQLDADQALAIAKTDKNLLLTARAGSGKTRTIACKTVFLIDYEGVKPEEVLILAFNRQAANEIGNRIRKDYKLEDFKNARTFHGLAYQIVQPEEKPLFDNRGEFSRKHLSEFIQKIVRRIWNPVFRMKLYLHFRKELKEIGRYGASLSEQEYLIYRRNLRQVTLRGEKVKSLGEKYIADFLREHDIDYQYERIYFWKKRAYQPDFILLYQGEDIVIEHWGIDEADPQKLVPEHWMKSWDEYFGEMQGKREYWRQKRATLIETSIKDLCYGRGHFENILKSKLESVGIRCEKLSEEEILKRVVDPQITKMTELFVQFIQKAKKNEFTVEDIRRESQKYSNDERVSAFLELANKVYYEYDKALKQNNKIDFDDLVLRAAQIIDETKGECEIPIHRNGNVKIKDLKWVLIDEYQDFSMLFYRLIQSIRKHNPGVKLFCVGDNWQAINGFAGSNLKYFDNFTTLIEDSGTANLLTNYRSYKQIIEKSNMLMLGKGEPSKGFSNQYGEVIIKYIDDVFVEARKAVENSEAKKNDERFIFYGSGGRIDDNDFLKAKYLKKCYEIIAQNVGMEVKILTRTNKIYNTSLEDFYYKLKRCFSTEGLAKIGRFEDRIKICTIHRSKGLEADIVIILQVCDGLFPLIHPDNQLFEVFGETIKEILDEERRLFYVAITRAKKKLIILTEKDRESDYLRELKLIP